MQGTCIYNYYKQEHNKKINKTMETQCKTNYYKPANDKRDLKELELGEDTMVLCRVFQEE